VCLLLPGRLTGVETGLAIEENKGMKRVDDVAVAGL